MLVVLRIILLASGHTRDGLAAFWENQEGAEKECPFSCHNSMAASWPHLIYLEEYFAVMIVSHASL